MLPKARLELTIDLLSLLLELLNSLGPFRLLIWSASLVLIFLLFFSSTSLTAHYSQFHRLLAAHFASSRGHNFINSFTEFVHCIWVVTRVLVFPSKSVLSLRLFPENCKHGTIVNKVEAIVDSLDCYALSAESHLVHEGVRLSN